MGRKSNLAYLLKTLTSEKVHKLRDALYNYAESLYLAKVMEEEEKGNEDLLPKFYLLPWGDPFWEFEGEDSSDKQIDEFHTELVLFYVDYIKPHIKEEFWDRYLIDIKVAYGTHPDYRTEAKRIVNFKSEYKYQLSYEIDTIHSGTYEQVKKFWQDNYIPYLPDPLDQKRLWAVFEDPYYRWCDSEEGEVSDPRESVTKKLKI